MHVPLHGEERVIGDIANIAQAVFDAERNRFVAAIRMRCVDYVERYGRPGTMALTGEPFALEATDLARGLKEDMAAAGCDVPFPTIASRTVLGAGYGVARACGYVASGADVTDIVFDGNDLEDYYISLHLGVDSNRVLVTNDEGTRSAISRTLAAFREYGAASGAPFVTQAEVITSDQFLSRVATS